MLGSVKINGKSSLTALTNSHTSDP